MNVRRLSNYLDAASRLGLGWTTDRILYEFSRRRGALIRNTPRSDSYQVETVAAAIPGVVNRAGLRSWLQKAYSPTNQQKLVDCAERIAARNFSVFGTEVTLDSWHHDPIGTHVYDNGSHWSKVEQPHGVDVKRVWELSRFGWAYDLARLHLLDTSLGASAVFFDLFESWMEENPPNTGINWYCGQEAAIRLIAVVLCCDAMRDVITPAQQQSLQQLALATANRIEANIGYARSQRNNHHTSEAAGLLTVGALFPDLPGSEGFLRKGLRELELACATLVLADGGSSQYSSNYHRVYLHGIAWGVAMCRLASVETPAVVERSLKRATDYWAVLADPSTGLVPKIGNDDGANILPVASAQHEDARPALALCDALCNGEIRLESGPWDEAPYWIGIDTSQLPHTPTSVGPAGFESFPQMGVHVLWNNKLRVILRAGPFDFRPAQADQLHVDVWYCGRPVATDLGTYSYNAADPSKPDLSRSWWHNTITERGEDHMPKVSRFLYARWQDASVHIACESSTSEIIVTAHLGSFTRSLRLSAHGLRVSDTSSTLAETGWWFRPENVDLSEPSERTDVPIGYNSETLVSLEHVVRPTPCTTHILPSLDDSSVSVTFS